MIINQCSTVFFDLTKPADERPEVLDIFSNAISHVVSFLSSETELGAYIDLVRNENCSLRGILETAREPECRS
jgi:hypothetical protein